MLRPLHRHADEIAPLSPRTVVVLHVLESEEILQDEPRDARTLPDAAVRNHGRVSGHALAAVQRLELVHALERPIVVAVLAPGDAFRARDMAAALAGFRESWRRENLAGELRRAADIDQRRLF